MEVKRILPYIRTIDVTTVEALEILEFNFKENIENEAPKEVVESILEKLKETQERMTNIYLANYS